VAVSADHQVQVDDLLAGYRRSRDQLASVHRALSTVHESATSRDGAVRATVGPGGHLTALDIHEDAYRHYRPERLALLIVETVAAAAAKAMTVSTELIAPVLPADADPDALLRGTADLTPAELAPPRPPDESFENRTWLESGVQR
jgi:DNA-binding protein YbaB